jgi:hypothetical protein
MDILSTTEDEEQQNRELADLLQTESTGATKGEEEEDEYYEDENGVLLKKAAAAAAAADTGDVAITEGKTSNNNRASRVMTALQERVADSAPLEVAEVMHNFEMFSDQQQVETQRSHIHHHHHASAGSSSGGGSAGSAVISLHVLDDGVDAAMLAMRVANNPMHNIVPYATSYLHQLRVVAFRHLFRNGAFSGLVDSILGALAGLALGAFYFDLDVDIAGCQSRLGLLLTLCYAAAVLSLPATNTFL